MWEQIAAQRPSCVQSSALPSLPRRTAADAARRSTIVAGSPQSQRLTIVEAEDSGCPTTAAPSDAMVPFLDAQELAPIRAACPRASTAHLGIYSAIRRECRGEDREGDESKDGDETGRAPVCDHARDLDRGRLGRRG